MQSCSCPTNLESEMLLVGKSGSQGGEMKKGSPEEGQVSHTCTPGILSSRELELTGDPDRILFNYIVLINTTSQYDYVLPCPMSPSPPSHTHGPLHNSVKAVAVDALDSKEMPAAILAPTFTVVAQNVHYPRKVRWHGLRGHVPRPLCPHPPHGLLVHDALLADRAPVVMTREGTKAVRVYGVPAREILRSLTGAEHVLAAHGAGRLVLVLEAGVGVVDTNRDAHVATVAVSVFFRAADAAEAALFAMEGALAQGHPYIALIAVVLSERDATLDAAVRPEKEMLLGIIRCIERNRRD